MKVGGREKKERKLLCCGENQGGFGGFRVRGGKSNGFKSSRCRVFGFGVKRGF